MHPSNPIAGISADSAARGDQVSQLKSRTSGYTNNDPLSQALKRKQKDSELPLRLATHDPASFETFTTIQLERKRAGVWKGAWCVGGGGSTQLESRA